MGSQSSLAKFDVLSGCEGFSCHFVRAEPRRVRDGCMPTPTPSSPLISNTADILRSLAECSSSIRESDQWIVRSAASGEGSIFHIHTLVMDSLFQVVRGRSSHWISCKRCSRQVHLWQLMHLYVRTTAHAEISTIPGVLQSWYKADWNTF